MMKEKVKKFRNSNSSSSSSSCIYFLGLIGALIYFISVSVSFWGGVLGFLKALVWPAFLVYEVLMHFGV